MPSKDSKQNFAKLRDQILAQNGKQHWRSVEEFIDAPEFEEFVKHEYPAHAEEWENGLSRRNFIKVMGASLAFAGLSGCVIQPAEKIVPYVSQPENVIPGKPLFYSTAMTLGGIATGLFAKAYDGRPIKIEGNPDHPGSLGGTDIYAQASILGMYDPDRSQEIRSRGASSNWQNFMKAARTALDENSKDGGAGVRFLTETVTSPTLVAQFKQIATELPNSKWIQYEPVNNDNAMAGARLALGSPANTIYKFDTAEKVLALDADIFSGFNNVRYTKDFIEARRFGEDKKTINRLYAVETTMTLTGAKADHRLAVKPSQMLEIAKAIAGAVGVSGASGTGLSPETTAWITAMTKDLQASRGKSIVVAGDNQPPAIHAIAHAINGALGNIGQTIVYTDPLSPNTEKLQIEQLRELVADIDAGRVRTLIILGGNPVYNTPIDAKISGEKIKEKVPLCIHLGEHFDETGQFSHWHIPQNHFLESWSDSRAFDGTVSITQPIIKPLYGGKSIHEVVQVFFKENFDKTDADILKEFWQKQGLTSAPKTIAATASTAPQTSPSPSATPSASPSPQATVSPSPNASPSATATPAASPTAQISTTTAPKTFEDNWRKTVHDGFVSGSGFPAKTLSVNTGFLAQATSGSPISGLEISILPDPSVYDGRFANNGWLQELPNPLTKITWDNVALVSPATAKRLGINQAEGDWNDYSGGEMGTSFINTKGGNQFSDLVTIEANGAKINAPVPMWIAPGQPDDVVTLYLGYGRTEAGRIANNLGYNAYEVMKSDAPFAAATLTKRGEQTTIASTQIHFNMEGRDLLLNWDVENVAKLGEERKKHEKETGNYDDTMYSPEVYQKQYDENHRWGMTIDLNSCVGCNACVLACQAENNIPVVGKEQVERSREMHWLRIDAYFEGDINKPDGPNFQPVLCQQCEQAPCEVVCPVHATVHSAEGLNDMVYNRCIGTRYCSNNCPYKVRRFNFLLFQDWDTPQYKLMRNPEVSIRSRGVMEKCTYCTQRISAARIEAQKAGRPIMDGEILTACQSACPVDGIVFGDLNNKESKVFKMKKDERNYVLLNELNTQPRTTYLAALKNQNKEMPDYRAPQNDHGKADGESH